VHDPDRRAALVKAAPPGWQPHEITHRVDGWVVDPDNEGRIPATVAKLIARAMPDLPGHLVADVRARMLARQRMYDEMSKLTNECSSRWLGAVSRSVARRPSVKGGQLIRCGELAAGV
jgi:hypothetical protein